MAGKSQMQQFPHDDDPALGPTTYAVGYRRLLQEEPDELPKYSESPPYPGPAAYTAPTPQPAVLTSQQSTTNASHLA